MDTDVRQFSSDKILKHLDRVNEWLRGGNPAPITVELDMTNRCNHRCPQCAGWHFEQWTHDHDSLPAGLAERIVKQLAVARIRGLIFTGGGEPLCHRHCPEIVTLARGQGLDVGFITNGSLITPSIARTLVEQCTWIRVSLDAASPALFRKVHGLDAAAFNKVVGALRLLVETKKTARSPVTIGAGFLTCDYTAGEMLKAARLGKDLGVDYLQYRPMHMRNGREYHYADVEKTIGRCVKESTDTFKVLYSKHKYDMMRDRKFGRHYGMCYGHQFATVVGADAKMYLCCHMRGNRKYCIGDLRKNTFSEIWNSRARREIASNIDFRDCIPLCRDNTFNQILWNIQQPREHVNFL